MSCKHRVSHPGHTVHSTDCHATSIKHWGLTNASSASLTEDDDESTASQHEHLNDQRHGQGLLTNDRTEFREHTEDSHSSHGCQEDPQGSPLFRAELHTNQGSGFTINVLTLVRISKQFLELRIFVQIFAAEDREQGDKEQANNSTRNHDREELDEAEGVTTNQVTVEQGDHGHCGHSSWRADDGHLGSNRGSSHRTFWTNAILNSHVIDNRQHRIHNVTSTAQHSQEPTKVWSEEANKTRMFTQEAFCNLKQAVETASSLKS